MDKVGGDSGGILAAAGGGQVGRLKHQEEEDTQAFQPLRSYAITAAFVTNDTLSPSAPRHARASARSLPAVPL